MNKPYELEERLINFASDVIDISDTLPQNPAGKHLAYQLVRSCTSPLLNYGEARAAESRNDFLHKMKVCLKELRETFNCLRLIARKDWCNGEKLSRQVRENNELIAIFVSSINTVQGKKV